MAGKIRFSSIWNSVLLKVSSGEHSVPRNFVLLVTLGGTHVRLTVKLTVVMLRQIQVQLYPTE